MTVVKFPTQPKRPNGRPRLPTKLKQRAAVASLATEPPKTVSEKEIKKLLGPLYDKANGMLIQQARGALQINLQYQAQLRHLEKVSITPEAFKDSEQHSRAMTNLSRLAALTGVSANMAFSQLIKSAISTGLIKSNVDLRIFGRQDRLAAQSVNFSANNSASSLSAARQGRHSLKHNANFAEDEDDILANDHSN